MRRTCWPWRAGASSRTQIAGPGCAAPCRCRAADGCPSSHSARSQLHRNYGRLYAAQGKTTEALRQFANDIYYAALESGPEHVNAAPGYGSCVLPRHAARLTPRAASYFLMGASFHAQGRVEQGLAFFDKVVDVWYKFLASVRTHADEVDAMDEAQLAEVRRGRAGLRVGRR